MNIKTYKKVDAVAQKEIDVVLDHVNFFTASWDKKAEKVDPRTTVAVMGNGSILWLDVPLEQFRATMKAVKR